MSAEIPEYTCEVCGERAVEVTIHAIRVWTEGEFIRQSPIVEPLHHRCKLHSRDVERIEEDHL